MCLFTAWEMHVENSLSRRTHIYVTGICRPAFVEKCGSNTMTLKSVDFKSYIVENFAKICDFRFGHVFYRI